MRTYPVPIQDSTGQAIPNSRALIWGNNAAWLCVDCDQLLGNRTGDTEFQVTCPCGVRYEILGVRNDQGRLNLCRATGVRRLQYQDCSVS
jgi:hypothetical protein